MLDVGMGVNGTSVGSKVAMGEEVAPSRGGLVEGCQVGEAVEGEKAAESQVRTNPVFVTLASDVNSTNMLPDLAVTPLGTLFPSKDPSISPLLLLPSYTFTKSYPDSVLNVEKDR